MVAFPWWQEDGSSVWFLFIALNCCSLQPAPQNCFLLTIHPGLGLKQWEAMDISLLYSEAVATESLYLTGWNSRVELGGSAIRANGFYHWMLSALTWTQSPAIPTSIISCSESPLLLTAVHAMLCARLLFNALHRSRDTVTNPWHL